MNTLYFFICLETCYSVVANIKKTIIVNVDCKTYSSVVYLMCFTTNIITQNDFGILKDVSKYAMITPVFN